MNNQTFNVQTQPDNRAVYIKPNLENHPQYTKTVGIPCCSITFIGQPLDLISNPDLELIPNSVDIGI